ncbi:hypothetical protein KW456_20790, partial [Vibrio fluvialis]|nr:hypothetical protein [Vibrio fluvialis]
QNKVNQTDGIWLSRHRLLLLKDKSGFPRKAAMNLFYVYLKPNFLAQLAVNLPSISNASFG